MKRIIFCLPALFLIFANTTLAKQLTIADMDFDLNPNKTVEDAMIEVYYNHPEIIPEMENKCREVMEWAKGSFGLLEALNFRATQCITWETNKKLTAEQIELLAELHKVWSNVIMDQSLSDGILTSFNITFNNRNEYSLQLAVRFYNLIMKESWPECLIETGEKIRDINVYIEPCNKPSKIMKICSSTENPQNCMQEEIIKRIAKFKILTNIWATEEKKKEEKERIEKERVDDVKQLMQLTKEIITQLVDNKDKKNEEIIRLYNFYWLSILRSYKYSLRNIEANS